MAAPIPNPEDIVSRFSNPELTPSDRADALAAARDDDVAALAAVDAAAAAYNAALLHATREQLRKLADAKTSAQIGADQSQAKLSDLDRRHRPHRIK